MTTLKWETLAVRLHAIRAAPLYQFSFPLLSLPFEKVLVLESPHKVREDAEKDRKKRETRNEGRHGEERGRRDRERCVPGSLAAFRRFWSDQNLPVCRAHRHEYLHFDHADRHSLIHPTAAVFAFLLPFVSCVCLECHIHQSFLVSIKPHVFLSAS